MNVNTRESVDINKVLVAFQEDFHDHAIDGSGYNAQTTYYTVDREVCR